MNPAQPQRPVTMTEQNVAAEPPSLIYKTFDRSFRHALLIRRYGPIAIPLPPPFSESESVGVLALVNGGVKTTMVGPQVI